MDLKTLTIRTASIEDLPTIIALLADDDLGSSREKVRFPLSKSYTDAFYRIKEDPNHELVVLTTNQGDILGTLQLTFLQYLAFEGGIKALIEDVRVKSIHRGLGLGTILVNWAIQRSKEKGAHLVQLTSHLSRDRAIAFYEKLGFRFSHAGMKVVIGG